MTDIKCNDYFMCIDFGRVSFSKIFIINNPKKEYFLEKTQLIEQFKDWCDKLENEGSFPFRLNKNISN